MSFSVQASIIADVWITKYALTKGIYKESVTLEAGGQVAVTDDRFYKFSEFALTPEEAAKKAELMRIKEIARLQAKIVELKGKNFK